MSRIPPSDSSHYAGHPGLQQTTWPGGRQKDPLGFDATDPNRYAYARNDSVNSKGPFGSQGSRVGEVADTPFVRDANEAISKFETGKEMLDTAYEVGDAIVEGTLKPSRGKVKDKALDSA